jgi:hypothetical protein
MRNGGVLAELRTERAQENSWRREPLEEGRNGLVEGHCKNHFSAKREGGGLRGRHSSIRPIRIRVLRWVTMLEHNPEPAECKITGIGAEQENRPSPEIQMSMGDKRDEADDDKTRVDKNGNGKSDDPESTVH